MTLGADIMGEIGAQHVRSERTMIGGSLEIPRMIHGLWQLAGGHDKDVIIPSAAAGMTPL